MTSIKANTLANYLGQTYGALVGLLIIPIYLSMLGSEAFGLIGFYTLLQAWMRMLDFGMAPTLARELARAKSSSGPSDTVRKILRSLETIFVGISVLTAFAIYLVSEVIALNWLKLAEIGGSTVADSISLMGYMVGLRWLAGLYRSALVGLERQVLLNVVNTLIATLKYPCSVVVIIYFESNVVRFFEYQLLVTIVELLVIRHYVYKSLPPGKFAKTLFYYKEFKSILPFALGLAYTAAIWVIITQVDKLVFSGVLTLSEYGYYTLVATASGAILLISVPVSQALLPRLSALKASNSIDEMTRVYANATRFIAYSVLPATVLLSIYSEHIIYLWTGDRAAAQWCADILPWYFMANGVLAIIAFQYYLQYAYGNLRLHVIYNTYVLIICVPSVIYFANSYGPAAVGIFWLAMRLVAFFFWTPFVHKHFLPRMHGSWLIANVIPGALVAMLIWWFLASTDTIALQGRLIVLWGLSWRTTAVLLIVGGFYLVQLSIERNYISRLIAKTSLHG